MKKRATLAVALVALTAVSICLFFFGDPEPVYREKPLTVWLAEIADVPPQNARSAEAINSIREIGTNALPHLMDMLEASDSPLKRKMIELLNRQRLIRFRWIYSDVLRSQAQKGLWALGANAAPTIPILTDQLISGRDQEAAVVLAEIGAPAFSVLEQALKNEDPRIRRLAIYGFLMSTNHLNQATPFLTRALENESEYRLRSWAAIAIAKTGRHEDLVVPALVAGLKYPEDDTRAQSARALTNYPAKAREYLNEIRALANNDKDPIARDGGRDALKVLAPDP